MIWEQNHARGQVNLLNTIFKESIYKGHTELTIEESIYKRLKHDRNLSKASNRNNHCDAEFKANGLHSE